jgi:chorismate synthase
MVPNKDQQSQDYSEMAVAYRPSHADATYDSKYGIRAVAGGGRSSARETIGRVAAGAVAKKLLKQLCNTEVRPCCPVLRDQDILHFAEISDGRILGVRNSMIYRG